MKVETAGIIIKAIATSGAAMFGFTWQALAVAFVGAAASYHFEPEHRPKGVVLIMFGIFAMGVAATFVAVAAPHFPLLAWTGSIPLVIRAGLLGLSIRFLVEQGKRLASGWKRTGG